MENVLIPVMQTYRVSEEFFFRTLNNLSVDDLNRSPGDSSNTILWIAGHLASSRCLAITLMGESYDVPWQDLFGRGVKRQKDPSNYPKIEEIVKVYKNASEKLYVRLDKITALELDGKSKLEIPGTDGKILSTVNFLAYHETYHIGQMAFLLTWLGKEQLVG